MGWPKYESGWLLHFVLFVYVMFYFCSHIFVICESIEQFGILQINLEYLVNKGIFSFFAGNKTLYFRLL